MQIEPKVTKNRITNREDAMEKILATRDFTKRRAFKTLSSSDREEYSQQKNTTKKAEVVSKSKDLSNQTNTKNVHIRKKIIFLKNN